MNPKDVMKRKTPGQNIAWGLVLYSAIPIFQELAKYIIDYLQIPPDHEE